MKTLARILIILAVACTFGVGIYVLVPKPVVAPDGVSGAAPTGNSASANSDSANVVRQGPPATLQHPGRSNGNGNGLVSLVLTLAVFFFVFVIVAVFSAFARRRFKLGAPGVHSSGL